jgi:hypothetical protein
MLYYYGCFGLASVASSITIFSKLKLMVKKIRKRHDDREQDDIGLEMDHMLDNVKLELRQCMLGLLLAAFEDLPMGALNAILVRNMLITPQLNEAGRDTGMPIVYFSLATSFVLMGFKCSYVTSLVSLWETQEKLRHQKHVYDSVAPRFLSALSGFGLRSTFSCWRRFVKNQHHNRGILFSAFRSWRSTVLAAHLARKVHSAGIASSAGVSQQGWHLGWLGFGSTLPWSLADSGSETRTAEHLVDASEWDIKPASQTTAATTMAAAAGLTSDFEPHAVVSPSVALSRAQLVVQHCPGPGDFLDPILQQPLSAKLRAKYDQLYWKPESPKGKQLWAGRKVRSTSAQIDVTRMRRLKRRGRLKEAAIAFCSPLWASGQEEHLVAEAFERMEALVRAAEQQADTAALRFASLWALAEKPCTSSQFPEPPPASSIPSPAINTDRILLKPPSMFSQYCSSRDPMAVSSPTTVSEARIAAADATSPVDVTVAWSDRDGASVHISYGSGDQRSNRSRFPVAGELASLAISPLAGFVEPDSPSLQESVESALEMAARSGLDAAASSFLWC